MARKHVNSYTRKDGTLVTGYTADYEEAAGSAAPEAAPTLPEPLTDQPNDTDDGETALGAAYARMQEKTIGKLPAAEDWLAAPPPLVAHEIETMTAAGFDGPQIEAVIKSHLNNLERDIKRQQPELVPVADDEWTQWVHATAQEHDWDTATKRSLLDQGRPTRLEFMAYQGLSRRAMFAPQGVADELVAAAGYYDVDPEELELIYTQLRKEALNEDLPYKEVAAARRFLNSIYFYDNKVYAPPTDPATAVALHRLHTNADHTAHLPKRNSRVIVFDTETTGLESDREILTMTLLEHTADGTPLSSRSYMFRPQRKNADGTPYVGSQAAMDTHGLTPSDVASAPHFKDQAAEIRSIMDGATLVAHNARFDIEVLQRELADAQTAQLDRPIVVDTMRISRAHDTSKRRHTLGETALAYGIPQDVSRAHTADHDTEVAGALFFRMRLNPQPDPKPDAPETN